MRLTSAIFATNAAFLFSIELVYCQIVYRGKCKDPPPVQENFNLTRFAGSWHETSRSFTFFELLMRCVRTEYDITKEGKINIKIHGKDAIGATRSFDGKAEVKDQAQPARLRAKFRIMPTSINYDVLKTDYDNYAVLWSCNNMFGGRLGHTEQLWILSRHSTMDDFIQSQLYDFLDKNNIRRRYLEGNSRQAKCFPSDEDVVETAEVVPISGNDTIQSFPVADLTSNLTSLLASNVTSLDKAVLRK